MIALLQRVSKAAVTRANERRDSGPGLAVLLGVCRDDTVADAAKLAARTANLRIFDDADGKLNRSLLDVGGAALVVPQFTLCADTQRGRRPSYDAAAPPELGETLYRRYVAALRDQGVAVTEGWFRATMQVEIHNDGPVTVILQS